MKILLVDDNDTWRLILREVLSQVFKDSEFKEVVSGQKALNLILTGFYPDLIFIDIGIPGLSGFQLIKKLRTNPDTKISGLRIIVFTDYYDLPEYRSLANELKCVFLPILDQQSSIIEKIKTAIQEAV